MIPNVRDEMAEIIPGLKPKRSPAKQPRKYKPHSAAASVCYLEGLSPLVKRVRAPAAKTLDNHGLSPVSPGIIANKPGGVPQAKASGSGLLRNEDATGAAKDCKSSSAASVDDLEDHLSPGKTGPSQQEAFHAESNLKADSGDDIADGGPHIKPEEREPADLQGETPTSPSRLGVLKNTTDPKERADQHRVTWDSKPPQQTSKPLTNQAVEPQQDPAQRKMKPALPKNDPAAVLSLVDSLCLFHKKEVTVDCSRNVRILGAPKLLGTTHGIQTYTVLCNPRGRPPAGGGAGGVSNTRKRHPTNIYAPVAEDISPAKQHGGLGDEIPTGSWTTKALSRELSRWINWGLSRRGITPMLIHLTNKIAKVVGAKSGWRRLQKVPPKVVRKTHFQLRNGDH